VDYLKGKWQMIAGFVPAATPIAPSFKRLCNSVDRTARRSLSPTFRASRGHLRSCRSAAAKARPEEGKGDAGSYAADSHAANRSGIPSGIQMSHAIL
jgi:hypothetical protein